jgi:translation initiation factor IF-2
MGLRAQPKAPAEAVVLEGMYVKGVGPVADVVVQWGTLNTRDFIVVGDSYGRVKSLVDSNGKNIKIAPPSTPVRVMGLSHVPKAGADLIVVASLEAARKAAEAFQERDDWAKMVVQSNDTTVESSSMISEEDEEEEIFSCNLIVVANSDGSLSAVESCIDAVTNEMGVVFPVLRSSIGGLSVGDIEEAKASGAMLMSFNTKQPRAIQVVAQKAGLEIAHFDLIYEFEDKLREAAASMLPAVFKEERGGKAEALQIFPLNGRNAGSVIGLRMKQGKFERNSTYRLLRNGEVVAENLKVRSLRILKQDVQEVPAGSDCGLLLEDSEGNGILGEIGDEVECYSQVEVGR